MLPEAVIVPLKAHLTKVKVLHDEDLAQGFGEVYLPFALDKKYPHAGREWGWAAPAHPCARGIRASMYSTVRVSLQPIIG